MFKYKRSNAANQYDFEIENLVTKLHDSASDVWESITKVNINYGRKTITFNVFDLEGGGTERFFEHLSQDEIFARLRVFNRSGNTDYVKRFRGIQIIDRTVGFDYAKQEGVIHEVSATYESDEFEEVLFDEDAED